MQMWVGYEHVKVLRIFGLQPTGIRDDLQSWSPDLYNFFMFFKNKKKHENKERYTQKYWIYSLLKQTMMAISVQLNLVEKVISRK
jgi:hypothetical protein